MQQSMHSGQKPKTHAHACKGNRGRHSGAGREGGSVHWGTPQAFPPPSKVTTQVSFGAPVLGTPLPDPQNSLIAGVPTQAANRPRCALPQLTCLSFLPNLPQTMHLAPPDSRTIWCPWASLTSLGTQSCLHCMRRLTLFPGWPVLLWHLLHGSHLPLMTKSCLRRYASHLSALEGPCFCLKLAR